MLLLQNKQDELKKIFSSSTSREVLYQQIMNFGKKLPPFEESWKTQENLVLGCQSVMYLKTIYEEGKLTFFVASDALISAGLASLLLFVYSDETPETVLTSPPNFLEEMGIIESLTPGRANGLASLYFKMKQEAVKYLSSKAQY